MKSGQDAERRSHCFCQESNSDLHSATITIILSNQFHELEKRLKVGVGGGEEKLNKLRKIMQETTQNILS